jgi:hypothetical protein
MVFSIHFPLPLPAFQIREITIILFVILWVILYAMTGIRTTIRQLAARFRS